MSSLKDFSDEELLEELVRRKNKRESKPKEPKWCENCTHFKIWTGNIHDPAIDDYNPCSKGHTMKFHEPEDYGDDFGFYRIVCPDRKPNRTEGIDNDKL